MKHTREAPKQKVIKISLFRVSDLYEQTKTKKTRNIRHSQFKLNVLQEHCWTSLLCQFTQKTLIRQQEIFTGVNHIRSFTKPCFFLLMLTLLMRIAFVNRTRIYLTKVWKKKSKYVVYRGNIHSWTKIVGFLCLLSYFIFFLWLSLNLFSQILHK